MLLFEGVGDVLQEDETQSHVLVLGGVHATAEGIGHLPELSFVADDGAVGFLRAGTAAGALLAA